LIQTLKDNGGKMRVQLASGVGHLEPMVGSIGISGFKEWRFHRLQFRM